MTFTVALRPLPLTAAVGTWRTLSCSPVTTSMFAVIPGFSCAFVRSSANVTS